MHENEEEIYHSADQCLVTTSIGAYKIAVPRSIFIFLFLFFIPSYVCRSFHFSLIVSGEMKSKLTCDVRRKYNKER